MKNILMGIGLVALVGCASRGENDQASKVNRDQDKKIYTCAGLHRSEKNDPLTEARDRLEIYKSPNENEFKIAGYGEFEKVNSSEGQGLFKQITSVEQDEAFKTDRQLFINSIGDSLTIFNSDIDPKAAKFHVLDNDYEIACQPIKH